MHKTRIVVAWREGVAFAAWKEALSSLPPCDNAAAIAPLPRETFFAFATRGAPCSTRDDDKIMMYAVPCARSGAEQHGSCLSTKRSHVTMGKKPEKPVKAKKETLEVRKKTKKASKKASKKATAPVVEDGEALAMASGLTSAKAAELLAQNGPNEIETESVSMWRLLLSKFTG